MLGEYQFSDEGFTVSWDMDEAIRELTRAGLEDSSARVIASRMFKNFREDAAIEAARRAEREASAVPPPAQTGNLMELRNGKGELMSAMDWTGRVTFKADVR